MKILTTGERDELLRRLAQMEVQFEREMEVLESELEKRVRENEQRMRDLETLAQEICKRQFEHVGLSFG